MVLDAAEGICALVGENPAEQDAQVFYDKPRRLYSTMYGQVMT